jgi:para-nitrobenzyl esterase
LKRLSFKRTLLFCGLLVLAASTSAFGQEDPKTTIDLGGTSWRLVKFQGSDDTTITPDDKNKYTIAFGTDGRVAARIDCNRGASTWKSERPNQLQFGPLALTRAKCRSPSMHDRIVKDWEAIRSYIFKEERLFLSLMADGGIYEFERIAGSQPAAPK